MRWICRVWLALAKRPASTCHRAVPGRWHSFPSFCSGLILLSGPLPFLPAVSRRRTKRAGTALQAASQPSNRRSASPQRLPTKFGRPWTPLPLMKLWPCSTAIPVRNCRNASPRSMNCTGPKLWTPLPPLLPPPTRNDCESSQRDLPNPISPPPRSSCLVRGTIRRNVLP